MAGLSPPAAEGGGDCGRLAAPSEPATSPAAMTGRWLMSAP